VADPELVASFFTLSGAGFAEPPRYGFERRCRAAATAGFSGIGLHVDDLQRTVESGFGVADMQAVLADTGLALVEIEFLGGWAFDVDEAALRWTEQKVHRIADLFCGRHVSAGEFRGGDGPLRVSDAAAQFARLSARAAEHGLLVAIEAFPWSVIRDVRTAGELLRVTGAPNAGLLVDVWHFFNCGATLDDLAALADLPMGGVAAVQLNDGPRVHEDFLRNARATRQLPGEGDLDVSGLVRAVERSGFTGPYCVEVNTPEFRALPLAEAARRAFETGRAAVQAARAPVAKPKAELSGAGHWRGSRAAAAGTPPPRRASVEPSAG
jgi:sugar phosphate isomerase/epimerase